MAPDIVALFPPHLHYCEPYCGGCAVLLAHSGDGRSELVNDINGQLMNFWDVLRDPQLFPEFFRRCQATPLSKRSWQEAGAILDQIPNQRDLIGDFEVQYAWAFFVRCRQSLAGRMTSFTPPTRTRLRRGMNGNVSEWLGAVDGLPAVHERLRRVMIENMDGIKLIKREDTKDTLHYVDCPYLSETRSSPDIYAYEMTDQQHRDLLDTIKQCQGKVMLSGYSSPMYETALRDWTRHTFSLPNNSAGGKTKARMTEVLWCNF